MKIYYICTIRYLYVNSLLNPYFMKKQLTGKYAAPEVCVKNISTERFIAASGGTEPSGSIPGKFDKSFDWSDFENFKF